MSQQARAFEAPPSGVATSSLDGYEGGKVQFQGVHHVAVICRNLENALEFYQGILGLALNPDRPDAKLPYRGAWLWIGPEMLHLMELPNPDPLEGRPVHGGRDRHFCVGVDDITPLETKLEAAGVPFTRSKSGRPAIFFRDPRCKLPRGGGAGTLALSQLPGSWARAGSASGTP